MSDFERVDAKTCRAFFGTCWNMLALLKAHPITINNFSRSFTSSGFGCFYFGGVWKDFVLIARIASCEGQPDPANGIR